MVVVSKMGHLPHCLHCATALSVDNKHYIGVHSRRSLEALSLPNIPTKTLRKIGKSQMNQLETAHREASKLLISSVKCPSFFLNRIFVQNVF